MSHESIGIMQKIEFELGDRVSNMDPHYRYSFYLGSRCLLACRSMTQCYSHQPCDSECAALRHGTANFANRVIIANVRHTSLCPVRT